jgi:hypothetical protein
MRQEIIELHALQWAIEDGRDAHCDRCGKHFSLDVDGENYASEYSCDPICADCAEELGRLRRLQDEAVGILDG